MRRKCQLATENAAIRAAEVEAGKNIGCLGLSKRGALGSTYHSCSCGWNSTLHWNGAGHARDEWIEHIKSKGAHIEYP